MTIQALINKIFRANQTQNNTVSWSGSNGLKSIQEDIVSTLRERTFFTVPTTTDLLNQGFNNAILCYVQDEAFYRWSATGTPNGTTIFPANDGGVWIQETIGQTDGTVTSIGITAPAAFTVTNSPVTTSGVIDIAANGTASEYIKGDGTLGTLPTSLISGSGTTNYVSKWSNATTLTDGLIYDNGTYTGIGTTNPLARLHIKVPFNNPQRGLLCLETTSAGANPFQSFWSNNAWVGYIDVHQNYFNIQSVTNGLISLNPSGGNVTVGSVTNAGFKFDVVGTFRATSTTTLSSLAGSGTRMVVADATGILSTQAVPTGTVTGSGTTNYLSKWTSSSTLNNSLVYDDGSSLGINTTLPLFNGFAQLTVNGTQGGIVIQGSSTGYSRLIFAKDDTSNSEGLIRYYHSDNSMQFFTGATGGATEKMRIASGGNVLIGTTTDAGYKLDVNGTAIFRNTTQVLNSALKVDTAFANIGRGLTFFGSDAAGYNYINSGQGGGWLLHLTTGAATYNANNVRVTIADTSTTIVRGVFQTTASITASSAIARGVNITNTLVAAANNDVLVGLDINPTFTNGAFTGVANWGARLYNSVRFETSADLAQGIYWKPANDGTTLKIYGSSYSAGVGYLQLNVQSGSDGLSVNGGARALSINAAGTSISLNLTNITFNTHGTGEAMRIVNSTKNVLIGTTTDAGYKLDVNGTARVYGASTSSLMIDTVGTVDMASSITFRQNSPNWSSSIGTHTSGGGLHYGLQFKSQPSTVNFVINRDGSTYFGGFGLANSSSLVELSSTTKGFLQPRMTTTQRNAIATPATGLAIYNTTTNTEDYYNGTSWVSLQTSAAAVKSFGAWQHDITQTAAVNNTGYGVRFDTADISGQGIAVQADSLGNNTLIKMANAGYYNIQFSFQFQNVDNQLHDVSIWLRKNGTTTAADVAGSGGFVSVPNSHGGTPGHCIVAWNYFVQANATDYFQLVWSTTSAANVTMEFYPAGSPPPSAASAILTVNQVN